METLKEIEVDRYGDRYRQEDKETEIETKRREKQTKTFIRPLKIAFLESCGIYKTEIN